MGRSPCCEKVGLKKGPWTPEEDQKLLAYIEEHGHGSWRALPAKAGLQRCGKSCRLRWTNYLRPDIKRGKFSLQEEQTIIQLHALLGNRWSAIATHLPKRTDNEIKNYWNTHIKKRLTKMGIDPVTHKPKSDAMQSKVAANLSHMAQWESARLEAEARLGRESKLLTTNFHHVPSATAPPPPPPCSLPLPLCLDVLRAWQAPCWPKPNAIFGAGSLESPTSTLNFGEQPFPMGGMGPFVDNPGAAELVSCQSELKCLGKPNDTVNCKERVEAPVSTFQDVAVPYSTDTAAAWTSESLPQLPTAMEGFTDILGADSSDIGDPGLEEDKNYWNSILSLLNTMQSAGSPVF